MTYKMYLHYGSFVWGLWNLLTTQRALCVPRMFSMLWAWTNSWINHQVIADLRRHFWRKGTVYPKKYAHGFCFAVFCCDYTLTDFPISIRLTSLALWQSNDCPSASKATLMNMDKYFMWIHYERLHNHNIAKHNKTVCIFLGIYCTVMISTGACCVSTIFVYHYHHDSPLLTALDLQEARLTGLKKGPKSLNIIHVKIVR